MHKTLARQVKRYLGEKPVPAEFKELLEAINKTYLGFDRDRKLNERSLEISSRELTQKNEELKKEINLANQKTEELEILNKAMTGREVRMAELKEELEKFKDN